MDRRARGKLCALWAVMPRFVDRPTAAARLMSKPRGPAKLHPLNINKQWRANGARNLSVSNKGWSEKHFISILCVLLCGRELGGQRANSIGPSIDPS